MPTLYWNPISQPSRAVRNFCQISGIEFEEKVLDLSKKEHKEEWYLKIHKFGQVPAWQEDDGNVYTESNSILRFLANKHGKTDLWPEDLLARQRVDAGLDFSGTTVRPGLLKPLVAIVVAPLFFGATAPDEETKAELLKGGAETIGKIETWLAGKHFIGGDSLSLADLQVFNELMGYTGAFQPELPENVSAWWNRCLENEVLKKTFEEYQELAKSLAGE